MDTRSLLLSWAARQRGSGARSSSSASATNGRLCTFMDRPQPASRDHWDDGRAVALAKPAVYGATPRRSAAEPLTTNGIKLVARIRQRRVR